MAYSPLGSGTILSNELLHTLATKYQVSPAQIALRFLIQHQIPAVTAASADQMNFMVEDLGVFDFALSEADLTTVDESTFQNDSPVKSMCIL